MNTQVAATADDKATDGLVNSKDLSSSGVSREVHENPDPNSAKFNKSELDRLVQSLKLSEEECVILLKALKKKNRLEESLDVHIYDNEISKFFHVDGSTKYIKDVAGLFGWLHYDIDPSRWTFDIIYFKEKILDCSLVDTLGEYESVQFLQSLEVSELFELLKQALEEADYKKYNWKITGDFSAKLWQHFQNDKPDSRRNSHVAATADGEATDGLINSNDLPSNAVSREIRENSDQNLAKFNKSELDRLVQSFQLSEKECVILLKALKEKNILEESIDVHVYDNHQKELMQFFHVEGRTRYIKDVAGLFGWLHYDIDPSRWILDICYNQTKKELDCMLIDEHREFQSVVFLFAQEVFDPFQILKQALEEADYKKYNWEITGGFKAKLAKHFKIT